MNCPEARELLWDLDTLSLSSGDNEALHTHLGQCAQCAREAEEIQRIQAALRAPSGIDVKERAGLVLARAMDQAMPDGFRGASHRRRGMAAGFMAMAAALFVAVALFWPGHTTAITISQLTEQHRICLLQGHHKNYRCHSEAAFGEMAANELGLATRPFMTSKASFLRGDICSIGGNLVAHALLDVNGKTVSFFRLAGAGEKLSNDDRWSTLSPGVLWRESGGHTIVLRRLGAQDWGLYTGQAPLKDFQQLLTDGDSTL